MSGLLHGTVRLESQHGEWVKLFEEEKANLSSLLSGSHVAIEHVGSTSVDGLPAKPIVDIAIAVRSKKEIERNVLALSDAGYEYRGDKGSAGGHVFIAVKDRVVSCHIHMVEEEDFQWSRYLLFRDALRSSESMKREYARVKTRLAKKFSDNRKSYTEGKNDCVAKIIENARSS